MCIIWTPAPTADSILGRRCCLHHPQSRLNRVESARRASHEVGRLFSAQTPETPASGWLKVAPTREDRRRRPVNAELVGRVVVLESDPSGALLTDDGG